VTYRLCVERTRAPASGPRSRNSGAYFFEAWRTAQEFFVKMVAGAQVALRRVVKTKIIERLKT